MALTSIALIQLACLIASGKMDQASIDAATKNLTPQQLTFMEEVQKSGQCLPADFESKIRSLGNGFVAKRPDECHDW